MPLRLVRGSSKGIHCVVRSFLNLVPVLAVFVRSCAVAQFAQLFPGRIVQVGEGCSGSEARGPVRILRRIGNTTGYEYASAAYEAPIFSKQELVKRCKSQTKREGRRFSCVFL
jgi:hypothetical protein